MGNNKAFYSNGVDFYQHEVVFTNKGKGLQRIGKKYCECS